MIFEALQVAVTETAACNFSFEKAQSKSQPVVPILGNLLAVIETA